LGAESSVVALAWAVMTLLLSVVARVDAYKTKAEATQRSTFARLSIAGAAQ